MKQIALSGNRYQRALDTFGYFILATNYPDQVGRVVDLAVEAGSNSPHLKSLGKVKIIAETDRAEFEALNPDYEVRPEYKYFYRMVAE
jgi:hypothetical protein